MAEGISWAADNGARVINLSYLAGSSSTVNSAANYARSLGALTLVSAGNSGTNIDAWPDFSGFVLVGATTSSDTRASFSNYGIPIDVMAPGVSIYTTYSSGGYGGASGTSFSAPITAGLAALIYSLNPSFTPDEVEQFIFSTAIDMGDSSKFGYGRINAAAAVQTVNSSLAATVTPQFTATYTPVFTATYTSEVSATTTPEVSATTTPEVSATSTPEFTATSTPEFTATATPEVSATTTPEFSATSTPEFTATATPEFSATATPEFLATATPEFLATATPEFLATATPEFLATATPFFTTVPATMSPPKNNHVKIFSYPNPADDNITFHISNTEGYAVQIIIYNIAGQKIYGINATLVPGGNTQVIWPCQQIASGIYLAQISIDKQKPILLKTAIYH
ncbi:S8 family serine peptidase [bacterium]|nr:S8 family serine peptidase [bacterium]